MLIEFAIAIGLTIYLESYFNGLYQANPTQLTSIIVAVAIGDYLLVRKYHGGKYSRNEKIVYGLAVVIGVLAFLSFLGIRIPT